MRLGLSKFSRLYQALGVQHLLRVGSPVWAAVFWGSLFCTLGLMVSTASAQVGKPLPQASQQPAPGSQAPEIAYENGLVRFTIVTNGLLKQLYCPSTRQDYAASPTVAPIFSVMRNDVTIPVSTLSRKGEILEARFLDPAVQARFRVLAHQRHFTVEVLDLQPADVDELLFEVPVRALKNTGRFFNATYNEGFGACLLGLTSNAFNPTVSRSANLVRLRGLAKRSHGIKGAKFALVVAPYGAFEEAIIEAERANGLPCPMLEGKWARDSEPVRRSYLFAVRAGESDVDKLIEYAKIGNFSIIMLQKRSWLANHGHFDINPRNFPYGIEDLKRSVKKIHAAGLGVGVHLFGPSISPNDPYITPKPDQRLAFVPCPPLAQTINEYQVTLTLTAQPELPPKKPRSLGFPGFYLQIGDEIIQYSAVVPGEPFRFIGCKRGALGTKAMPHPAGAQVKGLLALRGYFLPDPDSGLAEELLQNLATRFNECDFDMIYFDGSAPLLEAYSRYLDGPYYLNKMHLGFYRKLKKDVLYQTSNGIGRNILWHLVPRSASADGYGDIKGYLNQRWQGILDQRLDFTRSDIGWYFWHNEVRPDQLEYVAAKAMSIDASISLQTSRAALDNLPQSRQMMEMLGRWEKCRLANYFPPAIRAKLGEKGKDFKLFADQQGGWRLYRAVYEEPRNVEGLDDRQNVWSIRNDRPEPCQLGIELVRGQKVAAAAYASPQAPTIDAFEDVTVYRISDFNRYEQYVTGGRKSLSANGPVSQGLTQSFATSRKGAKDGGSCLIYSAVNGETPDSWGAIGRRFRQPLDLSKGRGLGLWVFGDGKNETLKLQFIDSSGRKADFAIAVDFKGWRFHTFAIHESANFQWSSVEYLLFSLQHIAENNSVAVRLDGLKMLPDMGTSISTAKLVLTINGQSLEFPVQLEPGQALVIEGPNGCRFYPGGMQPGRNLSLPTLPALKPGINQVVLSQSGNGAFAGDLSVVLYRIWPMRD